MKKQLLAALLITAFSGAALAQTVATVNGTKIDSTEVDAQVQMLSRESQGQVQDSPELRQSITKRLITRTLMIQEAKRLKIDQSPQYKAALDEAMAEAKKLGDDKKPGFKQDWATFQDNLLTRAFLAAVVGSHPVTPEETQAVYNDVSQHYKGSQEVQLGEIVTRSNEDAQKAIDALKAAVKDLKKGQYTTTPLQGNGIFAVFYINDKRAVKVPSFKELEPELVQRLQEDRVEAAIGSLYQKATIK